MSRYNAEFPYPVAYPPQAMTNVLAEWLSKHDIKQAHIAGQSYANWVLCRVFFRAFKTTLTLFSRVAHRDGKVRACHVLLQWRRGEAIRGGRTTHDRFSKSRDVRQVTKDECAGRSG